MMWLSIYLCIGLLIAWIGAEAYAREGNDASLLVHMLAISTVTLIWPLLLLLWVVKRGARR